MERIPFFHRIGTKIFATLIVVAILAVGITGTSLVTLSGNTLRSNISERNLQIARRASNEISLYVENSINELKAVADVVSALRDPWKQDLLLENLAVTFERFQQMHLVDSSQTLIASTLLDAADEPEFDLQTVSGIRNGSIYISEVGLTSDRLPYLTITLPVQKVADPGEVLVAELALRDIWDLVDDISFGKSGEALLVSKEGILIAHPDKIRVVTEAEYSSLVCTGQMESSEGRVSVYQPEGQEKMLVACVPVEIVGWRVVIQQPLAEAYLPTKRILTQSMILLIAVLLVAFLASIVLARLLASPLNLLLAGTVRIGQGDLNHQIGVRDQGEIGRLAGSFNSMVKDLKRRSVRLRESEERYRLMAQSVQDIIFSLNKKGDFLFINRRAEAVTGFSLQELQSRNYLSFFSPKSRKEIEEKVRRHFLKTASEGLELEVQVKDRRGAVRVLEVKLVRVFDSAGRLQFFGVARDITERKKAERQLLEYQQQLRSLASQLSLAEARERKRIAADLHDRIGQALSLTQIKLESLKASSVSQKQTVELTETIELIKQTIQDVRTLIFNLSSPLLYEVGLRAALEQLVEQFRDDHGIRVCFEDDEQPKPLDIDRSVLLFQAVRELLVNAAKHAHADLVTVSMSRSENSVQIMIRDDGRGFDTSRKVFKPGRKGGYGLFSIGERLQYMGGDLLVESRPGKGTKVCLSLGLKQDDGKPYN